MVEAPICCGGAVGLLLAVFGIVWVVNGVEGEEQEAAEETYEPAILAEAETPVEPAAEPDAEAIERATW
jgi:hypothetical protein